MSSLTFSFLFFSKPLESFFKPDFEIVFIIILTVILIIANIVKIEKKKDQKFAPSPPQEFKREW